MSRLAMDPRWSSAGAVDTDSALAAAAPFVPHIGVLMLCVAAGQALMLALEVTVFGTSFTDGSVLLGVGVCVLSAAVAVMTRNRSPRALRIVAVLYVVFIAFELSFLDFHDLPGLGAHATPPVWTCVVIAVFPVMVPLPPVQAVGAAFAAAITTPLALALRIATQGTPIPPAADLVAICVPPLLCAAAAYWPARLVHGMGERIHRAEEVGAYRLAELLGRGAMGEVWRGEHQLLKRPAAIKLIRREVLETADPEVAQRLVRRFEREAEVTARLQSPHTVRLFDYGRARDGSLFYVMELLEGMDLEEVLKAGLLPPARVVHVACQTARSLAEAHALGLVHRDIKPANLFVATVADEYDVVKVLDFGVARVERASGIETKDGHVIGSPAYMAPEAIVGPDVDARSDLYALGCVMYRLLSGKHVFPAASALKMLTMHASQRAPALSTVAEVPRDLEAVVMRCLEKDPAHRPQTALELAEALRACDVPRWTQQDAASWWFGR